MDIQRIADQYRAGIHTPVHPSYRAFVEDTLVQWRKLLADGFEFSRVNGGSTYATSADMLADIACKRLRVDTAGQCFADGHPLSFRASWRNQPDDVVEDGIGPDGIRRTWSINEIFRAVHDVNGHGTTQCDFETFAGEIEAYRNHARMYSPEAIPALYGETVGQLCHYFAGYGFVPVQRAVILP